MSTPGASWAAITSAAVAKARVIAFALSPSVSGMFATVLRCSIRTDSCVTSGSGSSTDAVSGRASCLGSSALTERSGRFLGDAILNLLGSSGRVRGTLVVDLIDSGAGHLRVGPNLRLRHALIAQSDDQVVS